MMLPHFFSMLYRKHYWFLCCTDAILPSCSYGRWGLPSLHKYSMTSKFTRWSTIFTFCLNSLPYIFKQFQSITVLELGLQLVLNQWCTSIEYQKCCIRLIRTPCALWYQLWLNVWPNFSFLQFVHKFYSQYFQSMWALIHRKLYL